MFGKWRVFKKPYGSVNESNIKKIVDSALGKYGKEYCLDIGCGVDPNQHCQTLDIKDVCEFRDEDGKVTRSVKPDFVGDIRELFAPGYMEKLKNDSSLVEIPEGYFKVILLHHVLEHIEWIYTDFFVRWVYDALDDGGLVSIGTPNAEFAAKIYLENLARIKRGKEVVYPIYEHIYCHEGIPWHVNKWFNFKCFSGCSPGDQHHSMFGAYALGCLLLEQGFVRIKIFEGAYLRVLAYKRSANLVSMSGTDNKVKEVMKK